MSTTTDTADPIRLAFMCVQNAGRSQMATAFAEREREQRQLDDSVEILTGGTHPADHVHEEVIEVMREKGLDLSERTPRKITSEELRSCEYVATMGCSALDVDEGDSTVNIRDWNLPDPHGEDIDTVRSIRDDIHQRVVDLFDDLATTHN